MVTGPNGQPKFLPDSAALKAKNVPVEESTLYDPWGDEPWDDGFLLTGTDGSVMAVAVNGTNIFIGGYFDHAGDIPAENIAKWDGVSWSSLGYGLDSAVNGLAVSGTDLYACGNFVQNAELTITLNHIAKWNGSSWSALGSGLNSQALAVATNGTDLYVGGFFTQTGDGSVILNRIAKWNGSSWTALGSGLNN